MTKQIDMRAEYIRPDKKMRSTKLTKKKNKTKSPRLEKTNAIPLTKIMKMILKTHLAKKCYSKSI